MKKVIVLLTLTALVISCAVKKEIKEEQNTLNGTWELASANFSKNLTADFKEGLPTLIFDNSENLSVYGYDGCNRIRTTAKLQGNNQIIINNEMTSTRMACNKVKSTDYQNALTSATNYELINDNVLFLKSDSTKLRFHKVTLNGNWYLSKIYVGRIKAADLYPYKKPFVKIDINQPVFSGSTACNLINGQLLMYQNTMKFNHITTTEMSCQDVNEKVFIDALNRVTHFKLDGTRLILLEKDKKIMELIQQYAD
ncbi:MAG TPA: META domain-containing protein [Flavobacterium sp.]|nr:META domain-containing protein [Flavobacterium sp.]